MNEARAQHPEETEEQLRERVRYRQNALRRKAPDKPQGLAGRLLSRITGRRRR